MNLNELILQGSALAVILGSFLLILQFVLTSFAKTLGEIAKALGELVARASKGEEKLDRIHDMMVEDRRKP